MLLIISVLLAILPWFGIAWFLTTGSITTVDGLFTSLILVTLSGIFAVNALWEFRRQQRRRAYAKANPGAFAEALVSFPGGTMVRGLVRSVEFFEAHVGQPNKSVVTMSQGAGGSRILVLEGDLRNRLPAGKKMEFVYRKEVGVRKVLTTDFI